jgi:hypothetical protein
MKPETGTITTGITMSLNKFIRAMIVSRCWAERFSAKTLMDAREAVVHHMYRHA